MMGLEFKLMALPFLDEDSLWVAYDGDVKYVIVGDGKHFTPYRWYYHPERAKRMTALAIRLPSLQSAIALCESSARPAN